MGSPHQNQGLSFLQRIPSPETLITAETNKIINLERKTPNSKSEDIFYAQKVNM